MNLRLGKIGGIRIHIARQSGFDSIIDLENPALMSKIKKISCETIYSCKPLKVECEFCKEKIGLLEHDVFTKSSKNLDKE